ncbi:MAG TPA: heme d1 biosynthesis radical SAM protein NirJ [Burkholderiales bacterium]|jgi:heme d1 biosynthesis radical SAM protein NirJ|nr:heme d1 biosynthesis radical SAM protein NirJ [Burkholderiales bacterium]
MLRLSRAFHQLLEPAAPRHAGGPSGPVVIWNLIRRCNLTCMHCYSISADIDFPGELETAEVLRVMEDLKAFGVPALILSGGEPLLRKDLFQIADRAKALGFYTALSTNGTLIDPPLAERVHNAGFDYVGISLDGLQATHDKFRRKAGAFAKSLEALRLCRDMGVKVGVRFTLTQDNAADLPGLLELVEDERIDRFYLSHLNYAGRGNVNRKRDAHFRVTREALDLVFARAWDAARRGVVKDFVTGNNDADGVYLLHWVRQHLPELDAARLRAILAAWGGNSSGVNVANIDNLGNVHPDTMWWDCTLGNVRSRPFSDIWRDTRHPIMAGLKLRPRQVKGRCATCSYFDVCGGNTRVRAMKVSGDPWAEDPGCYLEDEEIAAPDTLVAREAAQ